MATPDDDSFDSKQALSDMAKYLFQQQDMLPKFDLAMVITKLGLFLTADDFVDKEENIVIFCFRYVQKEG
jgi:hypothetical protein